MKNFIASLKLRLSDLFLLIGFLPFAIFLIFGQLFMQYQDPSRIALPLWASIICFVVMVICWSIYLYLEVYKSKDKYSIYIIGAFLALLLLNIIVILAQPEYSSANVIIRYRDLKEHPELAPLIGTTENIPFYISAYHKFIFISEITGTLAFIYIGLFVFPRRFTSLAFIKYLGYALFAFLGVLIVYGYIADFSKYVAFFKYVLGIKREGIDIYEQTVISFIIHRNAYGMCMMLGIIFAFINHSIENKWYYYLIAAFFYVNMVFSLCKTSLLISAVLIAAYVLFRLITTFKENKKRNTIILVCLGAIAVIGVGLLGIVYLSKGKVFGSLYDLIKGGGDTMKKRTYIWDNTFQLLQNGNWLVGRGFGIINLLLEPMNIMVADEHVFPTHSAYLGLLAEGGILFLLAYLALLVYSGYIAFKCYKKNPGLTITMSLGVISFVLYSFIETIHYLVYVFLFPIMVLYYTNKEEVKN